MAYPYYPAFNNYTAYQPPVNNFQSGNSSPMPQQLQTQVVVRVPSYDTVRSFSVEFGKPPVTFFDDNAPYCYVKTAGTSPVDPPKTRIFELIERTEEYITQSAKNNDFSNVSEKGIDMSLYAKTAEIEPYIQQIEHLTEEVQKIRFDIDAVSEKSTKKMVQKARKDADEE